MKFPHRTGVRTLLLVAALGLGLSASAAPPAMVEGMQMPAWRSRAGAETPLQVGDALEAGDLIRTGAAARVLVRLGEGSTVKVGERAQVKLAELEAPPEDTGVFKGFLDVLEGAFRFTTGALGAARARNITARVATVTIGIRGTDVWGKTEPARDFVVLIEGEITLEREGATLTLAEPLSLFDAPRSQPARPVGPVNPDDLARWAQETELQQRAGILQIGGAWEAVLASYDSPDLAAAAVRRLNAAGYGAQAYDAEVSGKHWTRVAVSGFADRGEASAFVSAVAAEFEFTSPWVKERD